MIEIGPRLSEFLYFLVIAVALFIVWMVLK
jgi:hypothetical protein